MCNDLRSRAGIVDQEGSGAECEAAGGDSASIAGASCQLQILSEESGKEVIKRAPAGALFDGSFLWKQGVFGTSFDELDPETLVVFAVGIGVEQVDVGYFFHVIFRR